MVCRTVVVTVRQTIVPPHLLGRVTSAYMTIATSNGAVEVGGLLASGLDLTAPFWFAAMLDIAILVWAWWVLGQGPIGEPETQAGLDGMTGAGPIRHIRNEQERNG